MRILIVEDEAGLRDGLNDLLTGAGHDVVAVGDGPSAVDSGTQQAFDLVLLDLMLPGLDGLAVCRKLRAARPAIPILMLTAKASEDDKVRGLRTGADDYITKPFGARELLARIDALARRLRATPAEPDLLECDGCVIDLSRCRARRGEREVTLTAREAAIVRWLVRHRGRALSRADLLEHVWGVPRHLHTRAVDMAISTLRHKIEADPAAPRLVVSVKGVGYTWGDDALDAGPPAGPAP